MTPIQASSLPSILDNNDVLAQAKTGSGKTIAFSLGLLNKIDLQQFQTQALVLCPTRELADQVASEIRRLARNMPNTKVLTLCGGTPLQGQIASLKREPHVIIGTPGRILKHLEKGSLHLQNLHTVVLDEADRMLDMGFHDDIMSILSTTNKKRQTLLFSATYPDKIHHVSQVIQIDPIDIQADASLINSAIKEVFYTTRESEKPQTLSAVLRYYQPESCMVFCNRKLTCEQLVKTLRDQEIYSLALHGDLDQYDRDQAIVQFKNSSSSILVATDVAARGLDIKDLGAVINYDLSPDPDIHIHRIGRTGRAGLEGLAITLVLPNEQFRIEAIERHQDKQIVLEDVNTLNTKSQSMPTPPMITLKIGAGRKEKIRPGDILGALTANNELTGDNIGKITIADKTAYVAIKRGSEKSALKILTNGKIKGRKFRVNILG